MSAAMKCGHVATGTRSGEPVCVSCFGLDGGAVIVDTSPPNLAGRIARCQYYGQIEKNGCACNGYKGCRCQQPSGGDLAFFAIRPSTPRTSMPNRPARRCCRCPTTRAAFERSPSIAGARCVTAQLLVLVAEDLERKPLRIVA